MKFEGDLEHFETVHTNKVIQVLEENGFTEDANVTIQAVGKKGDNYVASVHRILAEDKNGKSLHIIVKIAPSQEMIRQTIHVELLFSNEIIMYEKVLPKLAQLENGLDIPEEEKLRFPVCYGVISEAPNEILLLEDLKTHGFEMRDRMISLTNEELKMVLKRLATLHSLSYVLRNKEPELFVEYSSKLRNLWSIDVMREYFAMIEEGITQLLEEEEYKNRTRGTLSQLTRIALETDKVEKDSKYSVILHGDCWTNNLMFRFEENQLIDSVLIDYQVSRLSSPAFEVMYLIFSCTDREVRSKHYFEWLDYYHKCLDDSLANFGLKTSFVYPRDKFDADLKRYGKMAYGVSLMLANIFVRDSAEAPDMNVEGEVKVEEVDLLDLGKCKEETVVKLKKRFNDICASFIEYGYI